MYGPGTVLADRYRLEARVGAGGMGEVWRSTDQELGRTVAVKTMHPALLEEATFAQRFRREARAMATIEHPGVVAVYDYRTEADAAFLVMAYIDGEPLSRLLNQSGNLPASRVLELVSQAAEALHAAHEQGIIHRDVKPANLLIRRSGALVLTDFGIARTQSGTQLTATDAVPGTLSYLSPEQLLGQPATPLSDVYALGVVAYQALAGQLPFVRDNAFAGAMARVQESPPALPASVPTPAGQVVYRALATDPAYRCRPPPRWLAVTQAFGWLSSDFYDSTPLGGGFWVLLLATVATALTATVLPTGPIRSARRGTLADDDRFIAP